MSYSKATVKEELIGISQIIAMMAEHNRRDSDCFVTPVMLDGIAKDIERIAKGMPVDGDLI